MPQKTATVLTIAGSDASGGAGIQADIKTITALGAHACSAIAALTVQNTQGVRRIMPLPADFIAEQITAVLEDLGAQAIKTGMLYQAEAVAVIAQCLDRYAPKTPLVVDPILLAKDATPLNSIQTLQALRKLLIPRATVITPNIPEAEHLLETTIQDLAGMQAAVKQLLELGPQAVLLTGGHMAGDAVYDVLATQEKLICFEHSRIDSAHTHGTGCALASAIATGLAQGLDVQRAVERARDYVFQAILSAPQLGRGKGPIGRPAHTSY